jgi:glycosyltransferase involved in cell wall biosynthesis
MKILLLHDYGTPTGGAELQMLALRLGLRERGHDVRLLSSRAQLAPGPNVADYTCFGSTTRVQVLSQTANVSAYWQLRRALREFRPDVVHVRMFLWQLSPLILPLLMDVPSVYQVAVFKPICPIGSKLLPDGSPCHYPAGRICLRTGCMTHQTWTAMMVQRHLWLRWRRAFDRIVTISRAMQERLEAEGIAPVEVIYNGVPERPMRPPLNGPPTIAFAGRLVREKGIDVLLEATARLTPLFPDLRVLIAGAGPERERLMAQIERLRLAQHVTLLGHLSREALESCFDTAWVQAIPSRWEEPFGNVATEAMMRGTAVVASAFGGLAESVADGETGLLAPPGDIDALTTALRTVLNDRDLAERMGSAGRVRAHTLFSEDRCVDQFEQLYREISAPKPV